MFKTVLLAAPALLLAVPALASPPDASPAADAPVVPPGQKIYASPAALDSDLSKVVCRTEQPTGSRLGAKRVCKTRSEWAAESANARDEIRRVDEARAASARP